MEENIHKGPRQEPEAQPQRADQDLCALETLELLTRQMAAAVARCNRELHYVWANQAYADWIQRPLREIIGHSIVDVLGKEAFEHLRTYFECALSGKKVTCDEEIDFQGIGRRWVSATYTPTFAGGATANGWVAVVLDVTERKRAEEARFRHAAIVESSEDAIVSEGLDVIITSWNAGAERMFGYREEEVVGQPITILYPSDLRSEENTILERLLAGGRIEHYETKRVTKTGKLLDVSLTIGPIKDAMGRATGFATIAQDITQRKQAEQAVKESEQRFRLVADTAPVLIWMSGTDKLCTYFSKPWLDFTGRSLEEELGNGWAKGVHPDDLQYCLGTYTQLFEKREKFRIEYRLRRYDGEYRWVLDVGVPRFNVDGTLVGYIGICIDITERKLAEQERLVSEHRFRQFFETMPEYSYMISPKGEIIDANLAACSVLGYRKEELVGKPVSTLYAPECHPKMRDLFAKWKTDGKLRNEEMVVITKEGQRRTVLLNVGSVKDSDGSVLHSTSVQVDITERKMAEERLRESEEQFRTLAEAIPQLCWMARGDGRILWYNQRWYSYTGTTPEQMEGWGWQSVHDPQALPSVLKRWKESISTGKPFDMVFPLRGSDGIFRPFLTRVMPVKDAGGRVVRWFGTNTDITELRDAQEGLRTSEERLRLAQKIARIGSFERNVQTDVTIWTPELEAMYGLPPGGGTQSAFRNLVHPDDLPIVLQLVEEAWKTGTPVQSEWRVIWADGSVHWIAGRWQALSDESGQRSRVIGVNIDVTDRKGAELALRETNLALEKQTAALQSREELLKIFVKNVPAGVAMFDRDMRYLQVSDRWCADYSVDSSQVLGRSHYELFPDLPDRWRQVHRRALEGEIVRAEEDRWDRNGATTWIRWEVRPWLNLDGLPGGILIFAEDITSRKQMEQSLSRKLIQAHEEERTWIARELHDDISQRVALLALNLETLKLDLPASERAVGGQIEEICEQVVNLGNDIQALSHRLHSSKLEYLGLEAAAASFCKEFSMRQSVETSFHSKDIPKDIPAEVALCLFRVLQEALQNAAKHSGAKQFEVSLKGSLNWVDLTVHDSGRGFDAARAMKGHGLGLTSMRERLELAGGQLLIESKAEHGTTIHAWVPLSPKVKSAVANQ